ncbi:hypothetical protein ACRCUN_07865 [Mycobacterium sp. LTG2003]
MPRTTGSDEDQTRESQDEPPGPADHGREGGMATREIAPELTTPEHQQDQRE